MPLEKEMLIFLTAGFIYAAISLDVLGVLNLLESVS